MEEERRHEGGSLAGARGLATACVPGEAGGLDGGVEGGTAQVERTRGQGVGVKQGSSEMHASRRGTGNTGGGGAVGVMYIVRRREWEKV
jgi:hypothetical protein